MATHTETESSETTAVESSHLKEYLDYYKNLSAPGYGVLVTGAWGTGKTFQVKEILDKKDYHYISLFGTQTTEDVYSSVYAKMHPFKSITKDLAKSTDGVGAGPVSLGNVLSGAANAIIKEK
ncbi:hypothetical protein EI534_33195, partial [Pseudomonas frederiksbergensis]|nr:hypothetical protein [Pseudomonas frederiksbergensis]